MGELTMKNHLWFTGLICFLLIEARFPARWEVTAAQPLAAGGTLLVNTASDTITSDSFLSLREAMSIAAGALTGPFTLAERTQMTGCTFNSSGMITGGCGAGGDSILFAPNLTQIVLTARLPNIIKDGVTVNGAVSAGTMIINANAAVDYGFNVIANNVALFNLTVINISGFGAAIGLGNGSWKGLQVYNNYLGVLPRSTSCSDAAITARPYFTVILFGGSGSAGTGNGTAYIYNNVIGCSQNDAVALSNSAYVYVGQTPLGTAAGNWIGVSRGGANIGNAGAGVTICCSTASTGNQISSNHIGYNALDGINLDLVAGTAINDNDIFHNTGTGIHILDTSLTTLSNNLSHDNDSSGIVLNQASPTPLLTFGNLISGGAYYNNGAAGISEGNGADQNTWTQISTYGNAGLGIDKFDNGLPDLPPLALTGTTPAVHGVLVNGTLSGTIFLLTTYHIELYLVAPDPTGKGEGYRFLGSTNLYWNSGNNYTWSIPNPAGLGCYTATLTVSDFSNVSTSSEFSSNLGTKCNLTYLPAIHH